VISSPSDPFSERLAAPLRARLSVLGAAFTVESSDSTALRLALEAFGGLPRHRLAGELRRFRVRIVSTGHRAKWPRGAEPPRPALAAGNGLLCATIDAGNFAIIDVSGARALVGMSPGMLQRRYHARYELIELAMVTLASRGQSLVPLHAACVGERRAGVLLMGASGAGKSTVALHAMAAGMQLLSDDSCFVALDGLQATGTPNYLHVSPSATRLLSKGPLFDEIRRSPVISRRSGARKYEVDLRRLPGKLAPVPLRVAATVFLSRRTAASRQALEPVGRASLLARLFREQPYAAGLAGWREFEQRIATVPAYELRRTVHPDAAVAELRALLAVVGKQA
jgi:hypothetical protein